MNLKIKSTFLNQAWFTSICLATIFSVSCSKDVQNGGDGMGSLSIEFKGNSFPEIPEVEKNAALKSSSKRPNDKVAVDADQIYQAPFDEKHYVEIVMRPVTDSSPSEGISNSSGFQAKGSAGLKSNSSVQKTEPLDGNAAYQAVVYRNGVFVQQKSFTANGSNSPFTELYSGAGYQLVVYSFGKNTVTPTDASKAQGDVNFSIPLNTDDRFMYFLSPNFSLFSNTNHHHQVTVNNKLPEISHLKLTVDAAAISGNITQISNVTVESRSDLAFLPGSGTLQVGNTWVNKGINFPTTNSSRNITSNNANPIVVVLKATDPTALIKIGTLKIGNIVKNNLTYALPMSPGVRYEVELKIKEFSAEGYELGGFLWAPGNLVAKSNNGVWTYSFMSDQEVFSMDETYGDYWLAGKVIPNRSHTDMNAPIQRYNDYPSGDPCSKVSPEWRTPTKQDFNTLMAASAWHQGNPGIPGTYGPANIPGRYFGPKTLTAAPTTLAEQKKYLFLPFTGGYRNASTVRTVLDGGNYWTKEAEQGSNYSSLHVRNSYASLGGWWKVELNPIRCIKNL